MNEERKKILKMLDDGKIDVAEAEKLLSTVEESEEKPPKSGAEVEREGKTTGLKILVVEDGEEEVNISIPIGLVKMLKNLIPRKAKKELDDQGIDLGKIVEEVEQGRFDGKLVDVHDGDTHVEIRLIK